MNKYLSILLFFLCFTATTHAQQRAKVGLSLSGGGAKGMAHIGILKAIDKAGLKIDYITGTSMGSIIGAMYAAGYSGEKIEEIAGQLDWDKLLSGKPSFYDVNLYEKQEYENSALTIPFEGSKPALTTGLIESEEIWLQFSEIFFPVKDVKDFSQFNIPFKCIATDLSTGDAVVLDKGELVFALRASMAIPGVFPAVPYNDTELVDGGIIRNFPVTDLKEMGADYVIGVNLFAGLSHASELKSAVDVMYQITNYRDAADLVKEKALCNLLIEPPLTEYTAGSFSDVDTIMRIGNAMGEIYYPYFKHLADSLNAIENIPHQVEGRLPENKSITVDSISVIGLQRTSDESLLHILDVEKGETYSASDLNDKFRRAYAGLNYAYTYYVIEPSEENHGVLKCIAKENPSSHLNIGLSYHSFTNAGVTVGYSWRNLINNQSYSLAKASLSENWRVRLLHRQLFGDKLNRGLQLSMESDRLNIPIYEDSQQLYQFKGIFNNINVEFFQLLNSQSSIGVVGNYFFNSFNPSISATTLKGNLSRFSVNANFKHNSLDRRNLPRSGKNTELKISAGFSRHYKYDLSAFNAGDSTFTISKPLLKFKFKHDAYQALSSRWSLFENIQAGYIANSEDIVFDGFFIGGIQQVYNNQLNFVGFQDAQITTSSIMSFGLGAQYKMVSELYTLLRANIGITDFDNPFKKNSFDDATFVSGAAVSVAYYFSALPIEFSFMYSPNIDKLYTHINIGFAF
ncbi:patatin-like phospholipase family protein [Carboxylicivirga linearis]|uniref:Patatin-like phospholipase family protein n=1 Tax=Carboxylicivirga linearis TaxID=1628157 RepID=A0ABS5JVA5_9BACT|nr:patatin-like phospholipase family protein [Carboxylicivirga linearis]MBS2098779.1 patatin-like phospholipase family protein [Carboxylicivirga linearis]